MSFTTKNALLVIIVALLAAMVAVGCQQQEDCGTEGPYCLHGRPMGWSVNPTLFTKKGIAVDSSDQDVDLDAIDQKVDELESCVQDAIKNFDRTAFAKENSRVVLDEWPTTIERDRLVIKIAPADKWFVSPHNHQAFMVYDNYGKKEVMAAGVAEQDTAYITPDLSALKHEVIHLAYWLYDWDSDLPYWKCQ